MTAYVNWEEIHVAQYRDSCTSCRCGIVYVYVEAHWNLDRVEVQGETSLGNERVVDNVNMSGAISGRRILVGLLRSGKHSHISKQVWPFAI